MEIFTFGKNHYYISSDFYNKNSSLSYLEKHLETMVGLFTKRKSFLELLKIHSHNQGLEGYILFDAHASENCDSWMFIDNKQKFSIQDWIDEVDGIGRVILLFCCNTYNYDIHSKKSVVIHPKSDISIRDLERRSRNLRIYFPNQGYLDYKYYTLRRLIKTIEEKSFEFF